MGNDSNAVFVEEVVPGGHLVDIKEWASVDFSMPWVLSSHQGNQEDLPGRQKLSHLLWVV